MPLTFPSRSRVQLVARQAIAFIADAGGMSVYCLISTDTLTRHFAASRDSVMQIFDRNRQLIEEAAALCYPTVGSDRHGELILTELDLHRAETARSDRLAQATGDASELAHRDLLLEEAIYRLIFSNRA